MRCSVSLDCFNFALVCALAGVAVASVSVQAAHAQTPPTSAITSTTNLAISTLPAPYQDKVIEGLSNEDSDGLALKKYDVSGLPRGYSLEGLWDQRRAALQNSSATGLKISGYIDTPYYGSLSGQATLQNQVVNTPSAGQSTRAQQWSYSLRQIGMPFEGGWRADNALGMINLPSLDLSKQHTRLSLPNPAILGFSSQFQQAQGLSVLLSGGQAGSFDGYPASGFKTTQGDYALVGVQQRTAAVDGVWRWGASLGQAHNVSSVAAAVGASAPGRDAQSAYLSARREWGERRPSSDESFVQVNAVTSRQATDDTHSTGLWVDSGITLGAHQYSGGFFALEPNLNWLDLPIANDLQGAYGRHAWRTRQWTVESGLELFRSISGATSAGFFTNHNARYQYSSSVNWGAAVSFRRYAGDAQSGLLYSQFSNFLGSTRLQGNAASASTGERQYKIQLDHDWSFFQTMRLSTALTLERERIPEPSRFSNTNSAGAAVNVDWILSNNLTLSHSLQGRKSANSKQYAFNTNVSWSFAPGWSLQGSFYANSGSARATALAQSPLTAVQAASVSTRDSGVFVSLRYQNDAGRASAPLGGATGSAAGKLQGSIFLDDNKNAKRDANERSAANLTVLLDGRFAAQTDAQGRFEFPFVVAGPHILTVISDNLPLPWSLDNDGRTQVRVYTRETTSVDIGAVKP